MNEEQHYTLTPINSGSLPSETYTGFYIDVDDGYYITKDDIRVTNSNSDKLEDNSFMILLQDDLSYAIICRFELQDSSDIHVTVHEKHGDTELPEVVKQKIMDEAYTVDVSCDIDEISMHIDGTNYLQSCSLDVDRFIKGQGVIGSFVANEFELNLMGFPNSNIVGDHLSVLATIHYQDEGTNYDYNIPIGKYIISTCTYDDTSGTYTIKAYDNALLYNVDYIPNVQFPCTTIELVNDVAKQIGQKLADTTDGYVGIIPAHSNYNRCYFTVNGTNYGFPIDNTDTYISDFDYDTGFVFNGTDVLIDQYHPASFISEYEGDSGGSFDACIIYISAKVEEIQDTDGYLYIDVHPVQYTSFNNNLFVIPSNPFDVMTQTNQNDQSVTVTHASCRKVIQDVAKLLYGWAYINSDGELAFDMLRQITTYYTDNFIIDSKVRIHEPNNPNEIISPHNPQEIEYLTKGQMSVTTNHAVLNPSNIMRHESWDGLNVTIDNCIIRLELPDGETSITTTNDEQIIRKVDVDYLLPQEMFVRWEQDEFEYTPYTKYISNGEEIISTDTTILFNTGDHIIEFGYVLEPHTYVDGRGALAVYLSTMNNYSHALEEWMGDYSNNRYGALFYIDDEHKTSVEYVMDITDPNFGKVIRHIGVLGSDASDVSWWEYDTENELFYIELPDKYYPDTYVNADSPSVPIKVLDGTTVLCKYFQANTPDSTDDYFMYISDNKLYIKDRDCTSLEEWGEWLESVADDFIISFALEEPIDVEESPILSFIMWAYATREASYRTSLIAFTSLGPEIKYLYRKTNIDTRYNYIDTNHYMTSKQIGERTVPISRVLLGLKDIEGENVAYSFAEYPHLLGENTRMMSWGFVDEFYLEVGNYNTIEIYDNDITYTPDLRMLALAGGAQELFCLSYTPLEIETPGIPWLLNCTGYIFDNVDDTTMNSYAFKSHFEYKGYIKQKISSEADTPVESDYTYDGSQTSALNQTRYIVDKQNQQITSLIQSVHDNTEELSTIRQDVRSWTAEFESVGGGNYIKNSVGLGDATNLVWEFTKDSDTSSYTYGTTSDASLYTKSGSRWYLNGYKMTQTINVLQNSQYAFACKIKKPIDTSENCYIKIYDTNNPDNYKEIVPDPAKEYNYDEFVLSGENAITPQTTNITVEVYASEGCRLTISDMMLNAGTMNSVWTPAAGEILTTNVKMDAGGLRVLSTDYINNGLGDYTMVTPSYFRGYGNNNGTEECVFQVSGTETSTHDLQVRNSQVYGNANSSHYNTKVVPVINSNYDGVAFIKTQGN